MARLVFNKRSVEVKDGEPMKEYAISNPAQ